MKLVKNIILLFTMLSLIQMTNAQEKSNQEIILSLGKPSKWNNINYILFSSLSTNGSFKERSYLIDKSSGKTRFEGKTNNNTKIIVLFNFKSKIISKSYVNGKASDIKTITSLQEITNQLFEDSKLLFLPMLVASAPKSNITITPGKIMNAEKLVEINFKNVSNINRQTINGSIFLNNKGDIKEYDLEHNTYITQDIKDIGDGILLPTKFIHKNHPYSSIKFNTVAAFTSIEEQKFNNL